MCCVIESRRLYKYYSRPSKIEDFSMFKGELRFPSPVTFNDPYDCQLPLIDNNYVGDDKEETILIECGFEKELDDIKQGLKNKDLNIVEKVFKAQAEHLGILCLTNNYDSPLMWSHYAENNGLCIEYDMKVVNENIEKLIKKKLTEKLGFSSNVNNRVLSAKVIYVPSLSTSCNLFLHGRQEAEKQKYWHKLEEWSYEQEYRIGVSLGAGISIVIPNCVSHIYMGPNVDIAFICQVAQYLKNNRLSIPMSVMCKQPTGLQAMLLSVAFIEDLLEKYGKASNKLWDIYTDKLEEK